MFSNQSSRFVDVDLRVELRVAGFKQGAVVKVAVKFRSAVGWGPL
jgi:hypothetical protein